MTADGEAVRQTSSKGAENQSPVTFFERTILSSWIALASWCLKKKKFTDHRHNRYMSRLSFLFWVTHLSLITLSWLLWRLIQSFESHIKCPSTLFFFKTVWVTKTDYSCHCISIYVLGSTCEFIPKSCWDFNLEKIDILIILSFLVHEHDICMSCFLAGTYIREGIISLENTLIII